MTSLIWGLLRKQNKCTQQKKQKQSRNRLLDTENKLLVTRQGLGRVWRVGQIDEKNYVLLTSTYEISKSWGCNSQHRNIANNMVKTLYGDKWHIHDLSRSFHKA